MRDPRFTTVCDDPQQLFDTVDVDDLEDLEIFLMFLFHRPVGLLHLEDETGDAIEVRLWDDHGDLDRTVRFPMTLEDLVAVCADADDRLGPYTKATPGNPQAHATWAGMSEEERAAALLDALGKMRIFNLLNERVE